MKIKLNIIAGFSLVEIVFSMAILSMSAVVVMNGQLLAVAQSQAARDCSEVTQILVDRMETIRLVNFNQLDALDTTPKLVLDRFRVRTSVLPSCISKDIREVRVDVSWNGRSRTLSTLVARNGLQQFVYSGLTK
jgi:Tfp pilus assembly protein PilV